MGLFDAADPRWARPEGVDPTAMPVLDWSGLNERHIRHAHLSAHPAGFVLVPVREPFYILAAMCVALDLAVIPLSVLRPQHQKFKAATYLRVAIALHIASGIAEIGVGVAAWFMASEKDRAAVGSRRAARLAWMSSWPESELPPSPGQVACWAAGIALFGHVPSSFVMTPTVWGERRITVPAYLQVILFHALSAVGVLLHPSDWRYFRSMFIHVHIYVWVRVFYLFLVKYQILDDRRYTLSVLFAGLLLVPVSGGPFWPVAGLLVIIAINVVIGAYKTYAARYHIPGWQNLGQWERWEAAVTTFVKQGSPSVEFASSSGGEFNSGRGYNARGAPAPAPAPASAAASGVWSSKGPRDSAGSRSSSSGYGPRDSLGLTPLHAASLPPAGPAAAPAEAAAGGVAGGFYACAVANLVACLAGVYLLLEKPPVLSAVAPVVYSPHGFVLIGLFGLAFAAVARSYPHVRLLVVVFAVEKVYFVVMWILFVRDHSLGPIFQASPLSGALLALWGPIDGASALFFAWVALTRYGAQGPPLPFGASPYTYTPPGLRA
eukprot:tig00020553_g10757.t1